MQKSGIAITGKLPAFLIAAILCSGSQAGIKDLAAFRFGLYAANYHWLEGYNKHVDGKLRPAVPSHRGVARGILLNPKKIKQSRMAWGTPTIAGLDSVDRVCFLFEINYRRSDSAFQYGLSVNGVRCLEIPADLDGYTVSDTSKDVWFAFVPLAQTAGGKGSYAYLAVGVPRSMLDAGKPQVIELSSPDRMNHGQVQLLRFRDVHKFFLQNEVRNLYYEIRLKDGAGQALSIWSRPGTAGKKMILYVDGKRRKKSPIRVADGLGHSRLVVPAKFRVGPQSNVTLGVGQDRGKIRRGDGFLLFRSLGAHFENIFRQARAQVKKKPKSTSAGLIAYHGYEAQRLFQLRHPAFYPHFQRVEDMIRPGAEFELPNGIYFEWAFVSRTDGSGQPFAVALPPEYLLGKEYALRLDLHGGGGTHRSNLGKAYDGEVIQIQALGRSRTGSYVGTSESDILELLAFLKSHLSIDPDRVHISGSSMGGWGSWRFITKYPHHFASSSILCGAAFSLHPANAMHVPVFTVHSRDDFMHTVNLTRYGVSRLRAAGGEVVEYETDGIGHSVFRDREAVARAGRFMLSKSRKKAIRHIRFHADDGKARKAYWAEIERWGPNSTPASFEIKLKADSLEIGSQNVSILRLDLAGAPLGGASKLVVRGADGDQEVVLDSIPDTLFLDCSGKEIRVLASRPQWKRRLRFPGGGHAVYTDEPLMIVYGTGGGHSLRSAIEKAVPMAGRSTKPNWYALAKEKAQTVVSVAQGNASPGGPRWGGFTGEIPIRKDRETTADELANSNLIVIGTPENNSVLRKVMKDLPVNISRERVTTSDGCQFAFPGKSLGMLYVSPFNSQRLVYVISSYDAGFYRPQPPLLNHQNWNNAHSDFLLSDNKEMTRHARRNFNSDWEWERDYGKAGKIPEPLCSKSGFAAFLGDLVGRKTGADYVLVRGMWKTETPLFEAGQSTWYDAAGHPDTDEIFLYRFSGKKVRACFERLEKQMPSWLDGTTLRVFPEKRDLDPDGQYTLACVGWDHYSFESIIRDKEIVLPEVFPKRLGDLVLEEKQNRE